MRIIPIAVAAMLAVPTIALAQNTPQRGSTVSQPSPDIVKSFAPSGRLRAAINQGNGVLVQKQADGSRAGAHEEDHRAQCAASTEPVRPQTDQ